MTQTSKKQRFLGFMMDHHLEWVPNNSLTRMFGWSFNQRKNEMQRLGGIQFETRNDDDKPGLVWYRLVTDPALIDLSRCCLKSRVKNTLREINRRAEAREKQPKQVPQLSESDTRSIQSSFNF